MEQFINRLSKLSPEEFAGVAKLLGVQIAANGEMREFNNILLEIINIYSKLNRERKRNLDRILAAATSKEVKKIDKRTKKKR